MSGPPEVIVPPPRAHNNTGMSFVTLSRVCIMSLAHLFLASAMPAGANATTVPLVPDDAFVWAAPVEKERVAIIGSHSRHPDIVIEGLDSDEILTGANLNAGRFKLRLSNPEKTARQVTVHVAVRIPDKTGRGKVALPVNHVVYACELSAHETRVIEFPFTLSPQLWDLLGHRTAGFGLGTLDFVVSAFDADGAALTPGIDVAHVSYAPDRSARLEPPHAAVRENQGVPMLEINGRIEPSNFAYVGWNWGVARQTIREFAATDRHLYRIVFQPWSLWRDGKLDPDRFDRRMNELVASIVGNDPQALIYVFWWLHTPKDWPDHFPGQTIVYDDGTDATPHPQPDQRGWRRASLSSPVWQAQQDTIMLEASRRILDGPYADRVFGVSAGYGNGGEWNGYGYHGQRFSDYSEPARIEFQAWLKTEYKQIDALNRRWKTTHADWSAIEVPDRDARLTTGWGSFTGPAFPQAVTDYHRFVSRQTVGLIEHYGNLFKEVSGGRWLVGHFYGYFASHLANPPYHALDSGHFALGELLKSKSVDFIVYPYGYADRRRNLALGNAIASVQAAGKLYVVECDLATHLNAQSTVPVLAHHEGGLHDPASSLVAYWRDFSRISTGRLSAWWYDFGRGWYLFPGWTDFVQRVENTRAWQRTRSQASVAEVAVILDEQSAFLTGPQSAPYGKNLYATLAYELDETGAPWEAFLSTDIDLVLKRGFKVIILLNPIENASALADKLRHTRASLVWGYGAGLVESDRWSLRPKTGAAGLEMIVDPDTDVGTLAYAPDIAPIAIKGTVAQLPPPSGLRPRITINDPRGKPVAHYTDGTVAAASLVRKNTGATDYWLGTPQLEKRLLASIYTQAGVHRYTTDGSAAYANASSVSVWRQSGGGTRIHLPRLAAEVRDAWSGEIVGQKTHVIEVDGTPDHSTARLYLIEY